MSVDSTGIEPERARRTPCPRAYDRCAGSDANPVQQVPAAGVEPAAFAFSARRSYRLSYTGSNQRRRQESNLRQGRVAADRRSRPVRRLQQARAGGGTRTHLVRATKAVPGPSSIAGLFEQPVLVSSQLDRSSEPRSPPEGLARSRSRASGGNRTSPPPPNREGP